MSENAIWSGRLARKVASDLGYSGEPEERRSPEIEELIDRLTEEFRYLDMPRIQEVSEMAKRDRSPLLTGELAARLRTLLEAAHDLRLKFGAIQAADEYDDWSEEDLREWANQSLVYFERQEGSW